TDGRGKPVKLNGPLACNGRVDPDTFALSPDGAWAVFRADAHLLGAQELFSRRTDGSGPLVQLSGAIVANAGPIAVAAFSPDGRSVAYLSAASSGGPRELFVAPLDGSAPALKLSDPLTPGGNVARAFVSPDSLTVVYLADEATAGQVELFAVPMDRSAP